MLQHRVSREQFWMSILRTKDSQPVVSTLAQCNWLGAFENHEGMHGPNQKTLQFDITDQLKALGLSSRTAGLTVSFEANHGRVGKNPSKAPPLQAQAKQAFRSDAKVQIGAIELR